ncbi:MFS transporter [Candidatus Uhrbacteria bacterium]|nr:MFS transporter [Candidatus Uhrbacteria bacterium]
MEAKEAKQPTKFFGLSKNVISMGVVSLLNDLSSDMIFPYIPIFLTSVLGASATFVGIVEGVAEATASALKAVSGRISDRIHRRKPLIVFGYTLSAISKPLLSLAVAPWHVLVVRFFDRVGKGSRDAPRDALLSVSIKHRIIGKAFGFHRAADTMGAALGPIFAFLILPLIDNNLRTLFLLSFIASFFAVLLIIFFVKEVRNGEITKAPSDYPEDVAKKQKFHLGSLGLPFMLFLGVSTLFSLGKVSEAFLLLRAQDIGIALAFLPLLYFVYNISLALLSTPAGILSDKIGHRNTFMIGMAIFALTYYLFSTISSGTAIWFLFALLGLYAALTEGVGRAIVVGLVDVEHRATASGVYHAFTGLAALPAGVIFGVLWDRFGAAASFQYSAALALLSLFVFIILRFSFPYKVYRAQEG